MSELSLSQLDADRPALYIGQRTPQECYVLRDGQKLDPRLDLRNHSPTGFEWGYGGSGPAQLSLAILANYLEDDDEAQLMYQAFKQLVVSKLPREGFFLDGDTIEQAIDEINAMPHIKRNRELRADLKAIDKEFGLDGEGVV